MEGRFVLRGVFFGGGRLRIFFFVFLSFFFVLREEIEPALLEVSFLLSLRSYYSRKGTHISFPLPESLGCEIFGLL